MLLVCCGISKEAVYRSTRHHCAGEQPLMPLGCSWYCMLRENTMGSAEMDNAAGSQFLKPLAEVLQDKTV